MFRRTISAEPAICRGCFSISINIIISICSVIISPKDADPEIETEVAVGAVGVDDTGVAFAVLETSLVPLPFTAETLKL